MARARFFQWSSVASLGDGYEYVPCHYHLFTVFCSFEAKLNLRIETTRRRAIYYFSAQLNACFNLKASSMHGKRLQKQTINYTVIHRAQKLNRDKAPMLYTGCNSTQFFTQKLLELAVILNFMITAAEDLRNFGFRQSSYRLD
ncbi:hypothetical protein EGR_11177 [Echinococcus granulosus]|uniref:Uncharacterized protein n=1 Tax=Echinococcus granulosus TaxID=6210 RepID=W6U0L3_ECHGR|nr:hypothetical protein EGR_11177 [Echinococcus granulosus]EUB53966.1 hypothetical protein EGR_11177 [Echinococcus granulosus]